MSKVAQRVSKAGQRVSKAGQRVSKAAQRVKLDRLHQIIFSPSPNNIHYCDC